jgi:hypothetical protein
MMRKVVDVAQLAVLVGPVLVACRPGAMDGDTESSGDSSASCLEMEIAGNCFTTRSFALPASGKLDLASDLDGDGGAELLLRAGGTLMLLEFIAQDDPQLIPTMEEGGWMTAANLTANPGVEVVVAGSTETSILAKDSVGLSSVLVTGATVGPVGTLEIAGPEGEVWIVQTIPEFVVVALEGETWGEPKQTFVTPGCGVNWSASPGDYNGDGRLDAAFLGSVGSCDVAPDLDAPTPMAVLWSATAGLVDHAERLTGPTLDQGSSGDVDGDGIDDFLAWRVGYSEAVLLVGDAAEPLGEHIELSVSGGHFVGLGDLDGDGVDNVLVWRNSKVHALVDPYDSTSEELLFESQHESLTFVDANGDGIDDFLRTSFESELVITFSKGIVGDSGP